MNNKSDLWSKRMASTETAERVGVKMEEVIKLRVSRLPVWLKNSEI